MDGTGEIVIGQIADSGKLLSDVLRVSKRRGECAQLRLPTSESRTIAYIASTVSARGFVSEQTSPSACSASRATSSSVDDTGGMSWWPTWDLV